MNRNLILGLAGLVVCALAVMYSVLRNDQGDQGDQGASAQDLETPEAASGQSPEATSGQNGNPNEFRFSWDEFPEFQSVLTPRNREEYLRPHWTDRAYGDPEAPVQIVEFFSYACPHCKTFHEGAYQNILTDYVDTGIVQFIKRDFLLNNRVVGFELLAGAGAQCFVDEAQSQQFANLVFQNQAALNRAPNPTEALIPILVDAGLEETQARICMASQRNRSLVFGRAARATEILGVSGTPTLFINGVRFEGSTQNYASLIAAIARARN